MLDGFAMSALEGRTERYGEVRVRVRVRVRVGVRFRVQRCVEVAHLGCGWLWGCVRAWEVRSLE